MAKESTRVTKNTTKEDSERKPRGKKVVAGPKRGLSAYMYFSKEQRSVVKEENPGATFGKLGKLLGEKWKSLSEEEKKPYTDLAATDKKRYEDEKAAAEN
ncbi:hypothetical protein G6F56_003947 [Rhizopus delemar]|nr:hypothetical protein G6F56_003947 [Rhizopus delemar]